MTLNDVPWDGNSFGAPPYWGLRGTYWFNNAPNWGFMVDYHHAKVIADQGAVVSVSGTRDGIPVGPKDRVGNTFETMEFTDGLNELFFGGQYRWILPGGRPMWAWASALPSRMSRFAERLARPNPRTFDYQFDGVTVEGLVGVEYHFGPRVFGVRRL